MGVGPSFRLPCHTRATSTRKLRREVRFQSFRGYPVSTGSSV
jgi:hypothetical protein